jgi:rRNA-processing protein FCF1
LAEAHSAHFAQLQALPILVEDADIAWVLGAVLAVSRAHRLSAYGRCMSRVVAREGLAIATQDSRLQKAASGAGVTVLQ